MKLMKLTFASAALALIFAGASCAADSPEYTCPKQIEGQDLADYQFQGEYAVPEANKYFQVVAEGSGQFMVVGYPDGLPGEGWDRSKARFYGSAVLEGETLKITGQKMDIPRKGDAREVIFNDEQKKTNIFIKKDGGKYIFGYKDKEFEASKLERKSPTLGQAAPEGAIVIFDGTNLDQIAEGSMNEEAKTLWAEAVTKPWEARPFKYHLEFMTSYRPYERSQGRSNSGVYTVESYECQVLDSFGLEGENNECGGFYQQAKPIVNMAFPPLTWQTYDIDYTPAKYDGDKKVENARITVLHNGVVIHDNVELPQETPGRLPEPKTGEARALYLQGHGNHVQYRNIWLQYK